MATIGTFTLADGAYSGAIKTLTLNVRNAQLRPNEKADNKAPDYRIFAGSTELTDTSSRSAICSFVKSPKRLSMKISRSG